jgi:hypothetical protein
MLWTPTLLVCLASSGGLGDGSVTRTPATSDTPMGGVLKMTMVKDRLVAGENLDIKVTLENPTDAAVKVSPLQFFGFVMLRVECDGKRLPVPVQVQLSLEPDIEVGPHQCVESWADLASWFPWGLESGRYGIIVEYCPVRNDRQAVVYSNRVEVEVVPRSEQQEEEFQGYAKVLTALSKDRLVLARDFLEKYGNSMYACRVRLVTGAMGGLSVALKDEMLGESFERSSPTKRELIMARDFRARAYERDGRLEVAVVLLALIDEPWAQRKKADLERTIAVGRENEQKAKEKPQVSGTP